MKPLGILLASAAMLLATQVGVRPARRRCQDSRRIQLLRQRRRQRDVAAPATRPAITGSMPKALRTKRSRRRPPVRPPIPSARTSRRHRSTWPRCVSTRTASNDKETLTSLDSIDKHLAAAAKSHDEMKETCLKDNVDAAATMDCCKMIDDHLAKAIAEHDKLMKKVAAKK